MNEFAIPLWSGVTYPETLKIYEYTLFSSTVFAGRCYRYDMQRYLHEAFLGVLMLAIVYEHGLVGCMGTVSYINKDSESSAFRWVGISHGYTMSAIFGEWEGVDIPCYLRKKGAMSLRREILLRWVFTTGPQVEEGSQLCTYYLFLLPWTT